MATHAMRGILIMRLLMVALAATVLGSASGAHAEQKPIYVTAGTAKMFHTDKPFKVIHIGNAGLMTVTGVTDHDVVIAANRPDGVLLESGNVLLLDDQGSVVEDLRVEVTPFGQPSAPIAIIAWGGAGTTYLRCGNIPGGCVNAAAGKSRNGPDSVSTTQWSDGSSSATQTWHKK
jgi:hypothetical protein